MNASPGSGPTGRERPLEIAACRSECTWEATGHTLGAEPLFACAGCGSEWLPSEPWTPVDWTGAVPAAVQRARAADVRGARGRGWQTGQK